MHTLALHCFNHLLIVYIECPQTALIGMDLSHYESRKVDVFYDNFLEIDSIDDISFADDYFQVRKFCFILVQCSRSEFTFFSKLIVLLFQPGWKFWYMGHRGWLGYACEFLLDSSNLLFQVLDKGVLFSYTTWFLWICLQPKGL